MKTKDKWFRALLLIIVALPILFLGSQSQRKVSAEVAWTFEEAVEFLESSFASSAPNDIHLLQSYDNRIILRSRGNSIELERLPEYTVITMYYGEGNYSGFPSVLHVARNDTQQIIADRYYSLLSETGQLEPFDLETASFYLKNALFVLDSGSVLTEDYVMNDGSIDIKLAWDSAGRGSGMIGWFRVYPNGLIIDLEAEYEDIPLYEFTSNGELSHQQLQYFDREMALWGSEMNQAYLRFYPNTNHYLLHDGVSLEALLAEATLNLGFDGTSDYQIYAIYSTYNAYQAVDRIITYLFTLHNGNPITLVIEDVTASPPYQFQPTANVDVANIFERIIENEGRWTQEKLAVLDAFIQKWQTEIGQYYEQFYPDQSLYFEQGGAPLDYLLDMQIDGQRYSAEFSEDGFGGSDFNVVAVYSDRNDPNKEPIEIKTYFFAYTAESEPVVLFTNQTEGGAPIRFRLTENDALREAFHEIALGE